ncbi:MAG TPA: YCF48-related protein [Bacteroidota bacterium]|jgi:photosystem II stability/assembly factor-like uncharacterized protein
MKKLLLLIVLALLLVSGCEKETPSQAIPNKPPKTYLWLFPDSTIAEGHSSQHIRWWGSDPDGIVKGFLFASGRLPAAAQSVRDTIAWHWTDANDSVIAFPLLVRRDTFQIAVRAVDNTLGQSLPNNATIRFVPAGTPAASYSGTPFWDRNDNGRFDAGDVELPALIGAVDPGRAGIGIPVLNQPPSLVYAQNPNDPGSVMQQPETTFTAASFAWVGSDPDGDQTIANYELALNDPSDSSRWISVPGNVRLVSLVVPRDRSDGLSGVQEVTADVWGGTFATTRRLLGTIGHLKLDTLNKFFVRARDVAGDVSPNAVMPSDSTRHWFVKNPRGRLLIVDDYISPDRDSALAFYRRILPQVGYPDFEVLNIGAGLTAQQKTDSHVGRLVPPFVDPAFLNTLHLFDVVLWYTDPVPSLAVAQYPLFEYVRDASHRGKVIFSTLFATASDPRGAITDFSPLDSISSVNLNTTRLLPALGDTRIPGGYMLFPDSSNPADIFPPLQFNIRLPSNANHSVFMRPIYKRADAQYIYHIQADSRVPLRYAYSSTLSDLLSISGSGGDLWACGTEGTLLHTSDQGATWKRQTGGVNDNLNALQFIDANNGWAAGDGGAILRTNDGGSTWSNISVVTLENLLGIWFTGNDNGVVVGTNGLLIRTTDRGNSWFSSNSHTGKILHAVSFANQQTGIAVGDSGTVIKTTNGGASWRVIPPATPARLNSVRFSSPSTVLAAGSNGTVIVSTDAGDSWNPQGPPTGAELTSVYFIDQNNGWVCGTAGAFFRTQDGGASWTSPPVPPGTTLGQHLRGVYFSDGLRGWCVATAGYIVHTQSGGTDPDWVTQPAGVLNVGVIDGIGIDGKRSFVFLGLPLHLLDAQNVGPSTAIPFLQHVLHDEFGE